MTKITKARYWVGVLYTENMREDWQDDIADILQIPFAYCIHDKCLDENNELRKSHMHLILAFSNTTTYNHALSVFSTLNAEGKRAINTCEAVIGIRSMYDYLIHDTENSKKKNKRLYPVDERVTGNSFDIGAFEQISKTEKNEIFYELCNIVRFERFTNYADFFYYVFDHYEDSNYIDVLQSKVRHFEQLTKGNFHRYNSSYCKKSTDMVDFTDEIDEFLCPFCGSSNIVKNGKSPSEKQKIRCKECGRNSVI